MTDAGEKRITGTDGTQVNSAQALINRSNDVFYCGPRSWTEASAIIFLGMKYLHYKR